MRDNYHEWTECEMYGHRFYAAETEFVMRCQDCGDEYTDAETWYESMAELEEANERYQLAMQHETEFCDELAKEA